MSVLSNVENVDARYGVFVHACDNARVYQYITHNHAIENPSQSPATEQSPNTLPALSAVEHIFEGVKIFPCLLDQVANLIPVPYVYLAVENASTLVKVSEKLLLNTEQRDELITRVCALILVVIEPYIERRPEDIATDLKSDIERLTRGLVSITNTLRKIAAKCSFWAQVVKDIDAARIKNCTSQLESWIEKFEVSHHIQNAVRICEIATKVDGLDEILENNPVHVASTLPSLMMPSKPLIFHGRDQEVHDIAWHISTASSPCITVLGPAGMGKTSVALAVMEHVAVISKFGKNCFWVPCVEATSPSRLLDLLVASLRVTQVSNDHLRDIVSELDASQEPRVILMDNFETPWDLEGCRPQIEQILCELAKVSHIALLVTMRSNHPPSVEIQWDHLESSSLQPLDMYAAQKIYVYIHPDAESDVELESLLVALGCVPLAITLMATVGKNSGDMPTELLKAWNNPNIRTDLLSAHGLDPNNNINKSIHLSVNSNLMNANSDALTLLGILSMLPSGARRDFLPRLAQGIPNLIGALTTLTQSSLIEKTGENFVRSFHVLPVIRSYMLLHHPPSYTSRQDVYDTFFEFIATHKSEPGNTKFHDDARALADEETNIQTILIEATQQMSDETPTDKMFDALLSFSWYQRWTRPRTEIIMHTVKVARDIGNQRRLADALKCLGHMLSTMDRDDEARAPFQEAREIFQVLGVPLSAAQCLTELGNIFRVQYRYDDALVTLKDARIECETSGDAHSIAHTLKLLGQLYGDMGRNDEAYAVFEKARKSFLEHHHPVDAAHSLTQASWARYREKHYNIACKGVQDARQEYLRLAYPRGAAYCLEILGFIEKGEAHHAEALKTFRQAIHEWKQLGSTFHIAKCLDGLGDVYLSQSLYDAARTAFQRSRQLQLHIGTLRCKRDAAHCLEKMSRIYLIQSRHDEARTTLEEACRDFQDVGLQDEYRRSLECLEQI